MPLLSKYQVEYNEYIRIDIAYAIDVDSRPIFTAVIQIPKSFPTNNTARSRGKINI
jgi:hypothetical protein